MIVSASHRFVPSFTSFEPPSASRWGHFDVVPDMTDGAAGTACPPSGSAGTGWSVLAAEVALALGTRD